MRYPKPGNVLQMTAVALAALSALAACGGGDNGPSGQTITEPSPPVNPPPTNPPPTNPPPTNPPPTNPPPAAETPPALAENFSELDAAITNSVQNWPAWTGTGQSVGTVDCANVINYHIHTLLSIYRNGTRLAIPDAIGRSGCTYELHTHDTSGVVHIEAPAAEKFMLNQFFALWRQPFTATNVAGLEGPYRYYLVENGKLTRYTGDPQQLELTAYREIVILTGPNPPTVLPKYRWTPGL